MICLDTSFLIDLLKEDKKAVEKIKLSGQDTLATTRINIFEVLVGAFIRKGIDHQKFSEKIRTLMDKIQILELNELSSIESARIKSGLILEGREIETTDCLISGIMKSYGCNKILTKNENHFNRIKGIKAEGY